MHSNCYYYPIMNNQVHYDKQNVYPNQNESTKIQSDIINESDISEFMELPSNVRDNFSTHFGGRRQSHDNFEADYIRSRRRFTNQSLQGPHMCAEYNNSRAHTDIFVASFTKSSKTTTSKNIASVARRNARERRRIKNVNQAFDNLRKRVPSGENCGKISKVETLRSAIEYIRALQSLINIPNETKPEVVSSTTGEFQEQFSY